LRFDEGVMVSARSWQDAPAGGHPWFIAHRGASVLARENTVAAFEAAISASADGVETDIRLTADGHLVCHHDADLCRTAGLDRRIDAMTRADLRAIDPDLCPDLEAVLETCAGRCLVLLDMKVSTTGDVHAVLDRVHRAGGPAGSVAIGVRSLSMQAQVARDGPSVPTLGLLPNPDLLPEFVRMGGTWGRLWEADATAARIAAVHGIGLPLIVMVGTATPESVGRITPVGLADLLSRGPDGVMLDDPALRGP
jgi:glycerophosphoryl diester phosphodiesterase